MEQVPAKEEEVGMPEGEGPEDEDSVEELRIHDNI